MARLGAIPQARRIKWGGRTVSALVLAVVAYFGLCSTFANIIAKTDPQRASAIVPWNGRIAALASRSLIEGRTEGERLEEAAAIARQALQREPTAVPAVAALGLVAQLQGDISSSARAFSLSERLSRRDIQTQLWAIENSVARGDLRGALKHYDIALRTSQHAPDLLFPVLATAVEDASVRSVIVETLTKRPSWSLLFVDYIASNGPDPIATGALFSDLMRHGFKVSEGANTAVIYGLFSSGSLDKAWAYYAMVRGNVKYTESRDPRFASNIMSPSFFDWMPVNDTGITASIEPGSAGGTFNFTIAPRTSGAVLQQVQILPPGRYILDGHVVFSDAADRDRPYWALECRGGPELGRLELPSTSAEGGARYHGIFVVPAGCPSQTLSLIARAASGFTDVAGRIDEARLYPERGSQ